MNWFKALLSKLFPPEPVTVTPKSDWPDILNPAQYQDKIMRRYELANENNLLKMLAQIEKGHKIANKSQTSGPYTTHVSYQLDDGKFYEFVHRSSLGWVEPLFPS